MQYFYPTEFQVSELNKMLQYFGCDDRSWKEIKNIT